jgi:hypothetical protein
MVCCSDFTLKGVNADAPRSDQRIVGASLRPKRGTFVAPTAEEVN